MPSKALDARQPGVSWKRPEEAKRPPVVPASRSSAGSGVDGPALAQPAARHARAAGGANVRVSPGSRVAAVAQQPRAERAARRVAPERVVAGRALEDVGERRVREIPAGQRALGQHRRAQRLGDVDAGDPQLADPAGAAGAGERMATCSMRTRRLETPWRPSTQVVPARVHGEAAAADLDASGPGPSASE